MNKSTKKELTVVDLFSGGGIGAVGVKMAGFKIIYAIDNNKYAVETYNKNIGNHCVQADIRKLNIDDIPDSDIILGSPVCKSFSPAGNNKGFTDKKYGDLPFYYLNIIKHKKPKMLIFENVKGMISKNHKKSFDLLIKEIEKIGYRVKFKILNAYEYGVPQLRERLIVVGVRNDVKKEFIFPEIVPIENRMNIYDAIGDLPEPNKVMNSNKDIQYINTCNEIKNHTGYGIRRDEKPFVNKIPSGGNWRSLSEDDAKKFLGKAYYNSGGRTGYLRKVNIEKPSYTITSTMNGKNNSQIIDNREFYIYKHKNNIRNQSIYFDGGFSSRYKSRNRQKQWDEPSYTIVSEGRQLPLYPEPNNFDIRNLDKYNIAPPRRFTVRECLRLQSVPDWYEIDEEIPLSKQYEIVGNGIPSLLTYKIFNNIKNVLEES